MGTTRTFKSLGRIAEDAQATAPGGDRTIGTAYRNVEFSAFRQKAGKGFNNKPFSENVNQQINNLSKFTDLSDRQGVIGWKNDITYNVPALVLATDGKLYQALRDNLNNVDPVDDDQDEPQFWQELRTPTDISLDLSSQTPGDEGAELVGTANRNVSPVGRTLQKSLDENAESLYNMHDFNIVASLQQSVFRPPSPNNVNAFFNFNIDSITVVPHDKQFNSNDVIGYVDVTFTNPIPTDSVVMLNVSPYNMFFLDGNKILYHTTSNSYAELTSTSIKIGSLSIQQINNMWPTWGFDDPQTRVEWIISLLIYKIDP